MKQCSDSAGTINRLKRIEGQIRGIISMVENDRPCEDILVQMTAAKAALHRAGQTLLESHMHHCVLDGFKNGEFEGTVDQLLKAVGKFSRLG